MVYFPVLLQDISAFSEENFDTKAWVNKTLRNLDMQDKKEVLLRSQKGQLTSLLYCKSYDKRQEQILKRDDIYSLSLTFVVAWTINW